MVSRHGYGSGGKFVSRFDVTSIRWWTPTYAAPRSKPEGAENAPQTMDVIQTGGVALSESKFQCYFRYHMSKWTISEDLKAMLRSSAEYYHDCDLDCLVLHRASEEHGLACGCWKRSSPVHRSLCSCSVANKGLNLDKLDSACTAVFLVFAKGSYWLPPCNLQLQSNPLEASHHFTLHPSLSSKSYAVL